MCPPIKAPRRACRYTGTVTDYVAASTRHMVEYDDGDIQMLNLSTERVKVLGGGPTRRVGVLGGGGALP